MQDERVRRLLGLAATLTTTVCVIARWPIMWHTYMHTTHCAAEEEQLLAQQLVRFGLLVKHEQQLLNVQGLNVDGCSWVMDCP